MKLKLKVSKVSNVALAPGCPKYSENQCGIAYRSG